MPGISHDKPGNKHTPRARRLKYSIVNIDITVGSSDAKNEINDKNKNKHLARSLSSFSQDGRGEKDINKHEEPRDGPRSPILASVFHQNLNGLILWYWILV